MRPNSIKKKEFFKTRCVAARISFNTLILTVIMQKYFIYNTDSLKAKYVLIVKTF